MLNYRNYFVTLPASTQLSVLAVLFFFFYLLSVLVTGAILLTEVPDGQMKNVTDILQNLNFSLSNPASVQKLKYAQVITSMLIFILPSLIMAYLSGAGVKNYLCFNKKTPLLFYFLVTLLVVSAAPLINWLAHLNENIVFPAFLSGLEVSFKQAEENAKYITEAFLKMDSTGAFLFNMLMIGILPALGEELLFRGVVQKLFIRLTKNLHSGIWISAVLFSALHGQFYGFLPRMLLGALLGYLFVWTGSLWVPVSAHFINNGAAVSVEYLKQKGYVTANLDTIGTGENELYYVFISAFIVAGLMFALYRLGAIKNQYI